VVGFFGPWATMSGMGMDESGSGWDMIRQSGMKLPLAALVGGILAVIGSILVFAILRAIGGILALIGVAMGLAYAEMGAMIPGMAGFTLGAGYGTYLVVIGGILAILSTLGLKEE